MIKEHRKCHSTRQYVLSRKVDGECLRTALRLRKGGFYLSYQRRIRAQREVKIEREVVTRRPLC